MKELAVILFILIFLKNMMKFFITGLFIFVAYSYNCPIYIQVPVMEREAKLKQFNYFFIIYHSGMH